MQAGWGIRKMLCFQTQSPMLFIYLASLSPDCPIKEITGIKLNAMILKGISEKITLRLKNLEKSFLENLRRAMRNAYNQ